MRNIAEDVFSCKESKENSKKFVCGSDDCFFMFHSFFSFSFVVEAKHIGMEDSSHCYLPECPSQMSVTMFGNFVLTFEFSRFLDNWIYSTYGNDFFIIGHSIYGRDLADETGCGEFTYSRDRGEYFHLFGVIVFSLVNEFYFEMGEFFFKLEKSPDRAFKYLFPIRVINTNCIISNFYNFSCSEGQFASFLLRDFIYYYTDPSFSQFSCVSCGRDFKEEFKECFSEDIVFMSQFSEDIKCNLFDFVFEFSNFLGKFFTFSCQKFYGIISGIFFDFVGVSEKIEGDYFCRDFISFGFSEGSALEKFFNEQRVNEGNIICFFIQKVKDIDMVIAGGFHPNSKVLWVAQSLEKRKDFIKSFFILSESFLFDNFLFCVNHTDVNSIKGYIYANKIFIHVVSSFFPAFGGLRIGNRMLSLPSSKVIRDLCPNQPIGDRESEGRTPLRALGPGKMPSPCFQSLYFINFLIISSKVLNYIQNLT